AVILQHSARCNIGFAHLTLGEPAAAATHFEIDGHVDVVLSRGRVIVDESGYIGTKSHGRFVKRELSQNLI
ncbi:hypothetical protein ABZ372_40185, partial [Streptomyces sp. NPDC005921]